LSVWPSGPSPCRFGPLGQALVGLALWAEPLSVWPSGPSPCRFGPLGRALVGLALWAKPLRQLLRNCRVEQAGPALSAVAWQLRGGARGPSPCRFGPLGRALVGCCCATAGTRRVPALDSTRPCRGPRAIGGLARALSLTRSDQATAPADRLRRMPGGSGATNRSGVVGRRSVARRC
jgi:hypothetical protein